LFVVLEKTVTVYRIKGFDAIGAACMDGNGSSDP
jgi:hypothetical protein